MKRSVTNDYDGIYCLWRPGMEISMAEKTIRYHKLVRDRIPEIIIASGKTCTTQILPDKDYLEMLDAYTVNHECQRIF